MAKSQTILSHLKHELNSHMKRRLPPLAMLRAFEAAARLTSFSKAGEELHVTHSAISHQVRGLEERLGLTLFERTGRQVRLTVAGEALAGPLSGATR